MLVDAEPEELRAQSTYARTAAAQNPVIFSVLGVLSRMGVLRMLGGDPANAPDLPCLPGLVKRLPREAQAAYVAVEGQPRCFATLVDEEAATEQREATLRHLGSLGDLPLIVITRRLGTGGTAEATQAEQVWQALQQEQVSLSTQGTQVHATRSGHNIASDQPEVVIEAIARMATSSW